MKYRVIYYRARTQSYIRVMVGDPKEATNNIPAGFIYLNCEPGVIS